MELLEHVSDPSNRKIVVELEGGIGSQLFQLAAAISVGEMLSISDIRFVRGDARQDSPLLDKMTGLSFQTASLRDRIRVPRVAGARTRGRGTIIRFVRPLIEAISDSEVMSQFDSNQVSSFTRSVYMAGPFGTPWFRNSYRRLGGTILEHGFGLLRPPEALEPLVVAIRRTDFATNGWALSDCYYLKALEVAEIDMTEPLIVVGDDAESVSRMGDRLSKEGYRVEEQPVLSDSPVTNDFWAMASARRIVLSNSGFAWWASAVGDVLFDQFETDRLVVGPSEQLPADWVRRYLPGIMSTDMSLNHWRVVKPVFE